MSGSSAPSRALRSEVGLGGADSVDAALERLFTEGERAFPDIEVPFADWLRHVARHLPDRSAPEAGLAALHAADFYLACACALGAAGAAQALVGRHATEIEAALRGSRASPAEREELQQELWAKVLAGGAESPPRIAEYAGRGPLSGWLRVAAVRLAINAQKRKNPASPSRDEADLPADLSPSTDPELAFLKTRYRDDVLQALKLTLAALPADERNVLRLHFLDGLGIDRISAVYGVHRATAARWITRGRESLVKGTLALLGERLHLPPPAARSLVNLVRSQIELNLSSLFGDGAPPARDAEE